jgi:hypothetical protein
VMQSAILVFLVGSALCTGARTWGMILAGRAIAGVGGNPPGGREADGSGGVFYYDQDYHERYDFFEGEFYAEHVLDDYVCGGV